MEETRTKRDLEERLFRFAVRIVRLCKKLAEKPGVGRTLSSQLLRAGTAMGANYEEAQAGQSRKDFVCKTFIALKEAREAHYWIRLIAESDLVRPDLIVDLRDEAGQLVRILAAIVVRARGVRRAPPK